MIKLVAESLEENKRQRLLGLNEDLNMVSEGILGDWIAKAKEAFASLNTKYAKLNKEDEQSVRTFALEVATATYVADSVEAGRKLIEAWSKKFSIEALKAYLEKAAVDKFAGRTQLTYSNKLLKVWWVPMSQVKLENMFASGGTSGKTSLGGV